MEHLTQLWCYAESIVWSIMLTNCPQLSVNAQNNTWLYTGSEDLFKISYPVNLFVQFSFLYLSASYCHGKCAQGILKDSSLNSQKVLVTTMTC